MLKTFQVLGLPAFTSSTAVALPGLSPPLIEKLPNMPGSNVLPYVLQLVVLILLSFLCLA
jgi:hypothetical protein